MRGLKHDTSAKPVLDEVVAPYVGAWIETSIVNTACSQAQSHPTWVRGLKQKSYSHNEQGTKVAPYVGAWIETRYKHGP